MTDVGRSAKPATDGDAGARPLLAAAWMTGAVVSFSSMAVAGRSLSGTLDTFEMMMYRSFIGLVVMTALMWASGRTHAIRTDRLGLHIFRNIAHFTGQNLWFAALSLVTLAQVFALEFTSPIWVLVLAVLFAGERLTGIRVLAVALGFLGALLVAQPGSGGDPLGLTFAALSAIGFAASIVMTRVLTRTESIWTILFWLTATQAVFGLVTAGIDGDIAWPPASAWPWVVLIGLAGLLAHTCLTNALAIAPATVVTPMDFARLPVIAVVGLIFYAEPLDPAVIAGAALIFLANYANIWVQARKR